jgi:hypothetical protein
MTASAEQKLKNEQTLETSRLRVISALLEFPLSGEEVDLLIGPFMRDEIISNIRSLGFELPRKKTLTRDNQGVAMSVGIYYFTNADRTTLMQAKQRNLSKAK